MTADPVECIDGLNEGMDREREREIKDDPKVFGLSKRVEKWRYHYLRWEGYGVGQVWGEFQDHRR